MLLSSFFARSMAFTHTPKVQLPFALFSETFLTIRQNSLYVTVCIIARPSYRGYFIHSLSTLHYCNAPSLATRLTGDYRDRTYTGKCSPAFLDTRNKKAPYRYDAFVLLGRWSKGTLFNYLLYFFFLLTTVVPMAAPPLTNSKAIHKARLLVSPVCGDLESSFSFAVTVSAFLISFVPSLSL